MAHEPCLTSHRSNLLDGWLCRTTAPPTRDNSTKCWLRQTCALFCCPVRSSTKLLTMQEPSGHTSPRSGSPKFCQDTCSKFRLSTPRRQRLSNRFWWAVSRSLIGRISGHWQARSTTNGSWKSWVSAFTNLAATERRVTCSTSLECTKRECSRKRTWHLNSSD